MCEALSYSCVRPYATSDGAYLLPKLVARGSAVPLGQLGAILAEDERAVSVLGYRESECLKHKILAHGVCEVLLSTRHRRNAHQRVVNSNAEVVDCIAVRPQQLSMRTVDI